MELFRILITGIIMGNTICMLSSCSMSPLLYITATGSGMKQTLKQLELFFLSRIAAYTVMGAIAGVSGLLLGKLIGNGSFGAVIGILAGVVNVGIGAMIVIGQDLFHFPGICRHADRLLKKGGNVVLLGVISVIIPCVPLTSFLTQVMAERGGLLTGALEGASFGVGITLSVPFWMLAIFSGSIPERILRGQRYVKAFRVACGLVLIIIGVKYFFTIEFI